MTIQLRSLPTLSVAAALMLCACSGGGSGGVVDGTGGKGGGASQTGSSQSAGGAATGGVAGGTTASASSQGGDSASGGSAGGGVGGGAGGSAGGRSSMVGGSTGASTGGSSGGNSSPGGGSSTSSASTGGSAAGGLSATGGSSPTGGNPSTGGSGGSTTGTGSGLSTAGTAAGGGSSKGGAVGGSASTGGATGGSVAPTCVARASTSSRPQLTASQAANSTTLKYLAAAGTAGSLTTDNWNPTAGLGAVSGFTPNFTVAADGSGTHKTVQAALNAASGSARVFILVKAGTYREKLSIGSSAPPITIYGSDTDASKVVLVYGDSSAMAGGTGQSASFTVAAAGFQAKNLTISNDFDEVGTSCSTNCQAVALMTTNDKIVLENVRLIGNQDTVCFNTTASNKVARVYLKNSFIEGDTDYIFGRATVVIEDSEMHYTSVWKLTGTGRQIAPSTAAANSMGYLLIRCNFTTQTTTPTNKIYLGRSWDEGVSSASAWTSSSPNGQAVIRDSVLGAHIRLTDPWAPAATSSRPFDATQNRFFEYCNSGSGAGP